ncbi:MAG: hypothetical protein ACD_3C00014G0004 [uncultured bacterium (gcode 4)]|uniref:Uncharacterized protein n=1 Tax=uncultured bacterium (gcode 4) TaxID=1234023 RepID=K2GET4_9BACT|nr:MAG: hypothetical protein ACD_3C00014G0004 [uncultured bacterium (gcode 4)]
MSQHLRRGRIVGLVRTLGKGVCSQGHREFESLPLRQMFKKIKVPEEMRSLCLGVKRTGKSLPLRQMFKKSTFLKRWEVYAREWTYG